MSWTIDTGGIAGTPFLNNASYGNYTIPYWTFTGNDGKLVSKSNGDTNRTQAATTQSDLGFKSEGSDFATLLSIANETPSVATGVTIATNLDGTGTLMSTYSGSKTKVIVSLTGAGGVGSTGRSFGVAGWLGGSGGGGGARLVAYSVSSSYYISASPNFLYSSWVGSNSSYSSTKYLTASSGGNGSTPPNNTTRGTPGSGGGYSSAIGSLFCASNGASGAGGGAAGGSAGATMTYWAGSLSFSASSGGSGGSGSVGGGGGGGGANGGGGGSGGVGGGGGYPGGGGGGGSADFVNSYNGGNGAEGAATFWFG
jgi:hypothetical protein